MTAAYDFGLVNNMSFAANKLEKSAIQWKSLNFGPMSTVIHAKITKWF